MSQSVQNSLFPPFPRGKKIDKSQSSGYTVGELNYPVNMIFFKKKTKETPAKKEKPSKEELLTSLQSIVQERVLTAEGWRRKLLKKGKKKG